MDPSTPAPRPVRCFDEEELDKVVRMAEYAIFDHEAPERVLNALQAFWDLIEIGKVLPMHDRDFTLHWD